MSSEILVSPVFFPRRQSAPDMPLGLVDIQQPPHLPVQPWIEPRQTLGKVFMYGRLRDAEPGGGLADGRTVFDNVHRHVAGALIDICIQMHHSPYFAY